MLPAGVLPCRGGFQITHLYYHLLRHNACLHRYSGNFFEVAHAVPLGKVLPFDYQPPRGRAHLTLDASKYAVQVLAAYAAQCPRASLAPLLECVRWTAMARAEVKASILLLTSQGELFGGAAALLSRLAVEAAERQDSPEPQGEPRAAAKRTLQLLVELGSNGDVVAAQSTQHHVVGVATAHLEACPHNGGTPARLYICSVGDQFRVGLQAAFLAVAADGQHHKRLGPTARASSNWCKRTFLSALLKEPLCSRQGSKKVLLLACYLPEQ